MNKHKTKQDKSLEAFIPNMKMRKKTFVDMKKKSSMGHNSKFLTKRKRFRKRVKKKKKAEKEVEEEKEKETKCEDCGGVHERGNHIKRFMRIHAMEKLWM